MRLILIFFTLAFVISVIDTFPTFELILINATVFMISYIMWRKNNAI